MDRENEPGEEWPAEGGQFNELISQVYDVALDVSRYDALRETWENLGQQIQSSVTQGAGNQQTAHFIQGHFDRAMVILQQIDHPSQQSDLEAIVGRFDNVAAFAVTDDYKIAALNGPASQNLDLTIGGELSALPIVSGEMEVLLRQVRKSFAEGAEPAILRVRSTGNSNFLIFQIRQMRLSSGERILLAVTSELHWPAGFGDVLRDAFALTQVEAEIVRLLIDCCSIKEIAEIRGRSIETVRAQLKAILGKTETKSQTELVRLVLSMIDIAGTALGEMQAVQPMNGGGNLQLVPYRRAEVGDGRSVEYLVYGDPNGKPVLYVTAEYCYLRWSWQAEAEAKARGIKIIAPIRAGYGKSDPLAKNVEFGEAISRDFMAILDAENVTRLPVITIADEHNYPIVMEQLKPGTIAGIVAAGGGFPFTNEQQVLRMHKWYRFIQACARNTPIMLPYMLRMGYHLVQRIGTKAFLNTIYEESPADIAALNDPDIFEAIKIGSDTGLLSPANALDTFARQTIYEQRPELVAQVHWARGRFPVHFMCGLQDPSQSPETLKEMQVEFDWVDLEVHPDAGQLLLFTKWRAVLDKVAPYLE